ncbi:MAG: carbamoyltransferase HypF [Burkholderiales bacterium]|nr:carbamoyltransferase HypF [Burkholderiales bacterium]
MDERIICRKLRINGTVQGVGFRPFVYVLASEENLRGTVLNDGQGVEAVIEGSDEQASNFLVRLKAELPPLAKIDSIVAEELVPQGFKDFKILESRTTSVSTGIPADAAVCEACLKELTDRKDRRYRYPFINCTHCGPRYTITAHLPYDRPQTSMKIFPMCPSCLEEYKNPLNRRFHAQPNACPTCGPHVELLDESGNKLECADPIAELYQRLMAGEIAAVKGLGGFHLVCDARNHEAVAKLRELKSRPSKPFAVMMQNPESIRHLLRVSEEAEKELASPAAPILLCPKLPNTDELLQGIAPGLGSIGVMLPYTPIHWLLFFEHAGRPDFNDWYKKDSDLVLVMTSANHGGEPIVITNEEAVERLSGICSCYLVHNREILVRCDDSVSRMASDGQVRPIRRARGHTPAPLTLSNECPEIIALGAWLKNTACLVKGRKAIVSQHIGDLDRSTNCKTLKNTVRHLSEVFEIRPQIVACDMHPDFYSTRLAEQLANEHGAELVPIQHHHAHIASAMAQHGLSEPVIGLSLDGVGYGLDGTSWGGELLYVDPLGFKRIGNLRPVKLPGGDKCAREGWRIAVGLLKETNAPDVPEEDILRFKAFTGAEGVMRMLQAGLSMPISSSLGRMYDAAASLAGVLDISSYEGEAPAVFEAVANGKHGKVLSNLYHFDDGILDIHPLIVSMAREQNAQLASANFHTTIAKALADWAIDAARQRNLDKICLSGGCFLNDLLTSQLKQHLTDAGLQVFESTLYPCGDGGVALGQAWAAAMKYNLEKEARNVSGNTRTN